MIHLSIVCSISLDLLHFGVSFCACLELSLEHFQESYGFENLNLYCPWGGPGHTKDRKMISDFSPKISNPIFPDIFSAKYCTSGELPNVICIVKTVGFNEKYTDFGSTISKWATSLIFYDFEVLMSTTRSPNMKVKLHLEVVKLDIDFWWIWSNLFGVFITKGDLIYLHLFHVSGNLKIDSDISEIKSDIILRSFVCPGPLQGLYRFKFSSPYDSWNCSKESSKHAQKLTPKCNKSKDTEQTMLRWINYCVS